MIPQSKTPFDSRPPGECRDPAEGLAKGLAKGLAEGLAEVPGAYADFELIGGGEGSWVFEVRHRRLDHLFAIKLWRPRCDQRESDLAEGVRVEFLAAAESRASLERAPFVEIYDLGVTRSGFPYLVMPRIFGVALDWRLSREIESPSFEGMLEAPPLAREAGAAFCFERADFLLDRKGCLRIGDCGLATVLESLP